MELREIRKKGKEVRVTMFLSKRDVPEGSVYRQEELNDWVFANKTTALKYYNDIIKNNEYIITNNQERISQMAIGIEHLGEFVDELKKKKSIGKKLSKKMDKVIEVWETRDTLLRNIADAKKTNAQIKEILTHLKKVK